MTFWEDLLAAEQKMCYGALTTGREPWRGSGRQTEGGFAHAT